MILRYLVAIPVFNEESTLEAVLDSVRNYASDILVVDDGSTDRTSALLRRRSDVTTLRHAHNRGYGSSLIDAFDYAGAHDFDWIITIDCDEQHEPAYIPQFIRAARPDDADIISGSRYLSASRVHGTQPAERRAINEKVTEVINESLGLSLTDSFCGFKAYRVSALAGLSLTVPGYGMPLQLWVQAACRGLRIRELAVPLIYNDADRQFGGSLDDAEARLSYYYEVIVQEMGRELRAVRGIQPTRPRCATLCQSASESYPPC